jgi:hypothetical protein
VAALVLLVSGAVWWGLRGHLEGRRQKAAAAACAERLAAGERLLKEGNLAGAEEQFRQAEAELRAAQALKSAAVTPDRLVELSEEVRAQRQKLAEASLYKDRIRGVVQTLRSHLLRKDYEGARAAVPQTPRASPDPVFQSLLILVDHRRKVNGGWDDQLAERLIEDCLAWRCARQEDSAAAYVAFLAEHQDSPFADEARARLVDREVADILKGNPGKLPDAEQVEAVPGRIYSVINISNNTPHELTLRYSGPDSFKAVLAPQEKVSVEVLVGRYKVAASVNAPNVRDYAGEETSTGGNFEVTYYIESPFAPVVHLRPPLIIGLEPRKFEPWPCKRRLPAYLK